jgi:hypothetical protein
MAADEQNLNNHARLVPAYHIGVFFPLLINLVWAGYRLTAGITGDALVQLLLALALMVMFISIRTQILTVQDRVIRLEMRLRLARLLTAEQQTLVPRLTHKQLVALRFAGDRELPELVQQVADGALKTQKEIKAQVKDWQADFLRA